MKTRHKNIDLNQLTLIAPINDGESKVIVKIAKRRGLDLRVSPQPWGATLDKEPARTFKKLKKYVAIVEIPHPPSEARLRKLGHRLIIIDHHKYADGLGRYQRVSSLEQFAKLIRHKLNRFEKGMAINDRAWIYGLLDAGYKPKEVKAIREYDLAAQGLDKREKSFLEKIAQNAIEIASDVFVCPIPHKVNLSYVRDRLALQDTTKVISSLLVIRNGHKLIRLVFTGRPELAKKLEKTFGGSLAGDARYSMVWTTTENIVQKVKKFLGKSRRRAKIKTPRGGRIAN